MACLEDGSLTSVSKASHLSPENSREEEAKVCVQELQHPQMAAKIPSVPSQGVSRRKKSMLNSSHLLIHYVTGQ